MTNDVCIVSGSDAGYFPYLMGLLTSLKSYAYDKAVLDLGMSAEQLEQLRAHGVHLFRHDYPYAFPARRQAEACMPGLFGMLSRPYPNDCLSGYRVVVWIDADAWVQRPEAIDLMVSEAAQHGIAAVPEIDLSYVKFVDGFHIWDLETQLIDRVFGRELAMMMYHAPLFNSGVLAARSDWPIWQSWRENLQSALARLDAIDDGGRMVELLAFNASIRLGGFHVRAFPCTFNWLCCLATPSWDRQRRQLVEPSPPYEPISIVHVSTHLLGKTVELPVLGSAERMPTPLDYASIETLRRDYSAQGS